MVEKFNMFRAKNLSLRKKSGRLGAAGTLPARARGQPPGPSSAGHGTRTMNPVVASGQFQ